jgi:hypothetical protein
MLSALVLSLLVAEPVKLAATGFTCEGATETVCDAYLERFVGLVASGGRVKVVTQKDIAQVLGIERQKELLGCADDGSSCMAELADALGVDGVLNGTIAKTSIGYLLNVKVVRAKDATRWLTASATAKDDTELHLALDLAAADFRTQLSGAPTLKQALPWVTFGLGAVAAVAGGFSFGFSKVDAATLKGTAAQTPMQVQETASRGSMLQAAGVTLFSLGLALAVAGLIWLLVQ